MGEAKRREELGLPPRQKNELNKSPDDLSRAKSLFRWSILYMFGICLLLLISRTQLSVEFEQQSIQIFFSLVSLLSN